MLNPIPSKRASVFVAQIGARRHYAVPRALAAVGALERLYTDFAFGLAPVNALRRLPSLPRSVKGLLGRQVPDIPACLISTAPIFAASSLWDRRESETQSDRWARRNAHFGRLAAQRGFGQANAVYAFNGAALEIFQAARPLGLLTVLDQTAAPFRWNRLKLAEEQRKWPGWEDSPSDMDLGGRLMEREEAEWFLADRIVCGSVFVRETIGACCGPTERCCVLPYPVATPWTVGAALPDRSRRSGKVRLLFVGTLQLRKGIQYLAAALRRIPPQLIEARLVGPNRLTQEAIQCLCRDFQLAGARPRSEIAKEYAWADIFVLPTLSEGSANVCHEAMSAGLPIITTPNAGSMVEHEKSGLIVPAGDATALASAIERLACDAALRRMLGDGAYRRSTSADLNEYAAALADLVIAAWSSREHETENSIPA
jgi:glycosyltransferase involved in cell wall biosynthesis